MTQAVRSAAFEARYSPWRLRLLALLGLAFVLIGAWLVGAFGRDHPTGAGAMIFGWVAIIFFGACAVISIRRSIEKGVVLRIDEAGVMFTPWSDDVLPWHEVVEVHQLSLHRQRMIGLELREPARFPCQGWQAKLGGANRALTGVDAVWLSVTGTDRSHADFERAIAHHASKTASH